MPVLSRISPMLASNGSITHRAEGWAFEPKLDGLRALVYLDESLIVRTRNGHDITASLPEMLPLASALTGRHVVLDGELLAHQGPRRPLPAKPPTRGPELRGREARPAGHDRHLTIHALLPAPEAEPAATTARPPPPADEAHDAPTRLDRLDRLRRWWRQ